METQKIKVIFSPKAKKSIDKIIDYIEERGYPETAEKFANKLYDFGNSLAVFPDKYPFCRQPQLTKRKMRCAVFHKNYFFVYMRLKNTLIIFNIIHSKTHPLSFSV